MQLSSSFWRYIDWTWSLHPPGLMTDEEKCRVPPGIYHARIVSVESSYREALHDKEFEEVEKIEEIIEPAGIYFQLVYVLSRPDDPEE